jgi:hypothetical protein
MFLQNERGLGVKNGTLGTIEQVSPQSMAVRTDDGRSVAFDLKDYAHIDHGYAATIHKAQGMTVDRAHVLATPGMDSHGSYVACRATATAWTCIMAATTSPISRNSSARCRASGPRTWRAITNQKLEVCRPNRPGCSQRRAVERYARAASREQNSATRKALDTIRPAWQPPTSPAPCSASPRWPVRPPMVAARAIRAMQLEAEIRVDPAQRADRFVNDWQRLGQARQAMQRDGDTKGAQRLTNRMTDMAKSLERDAQVESLLRGRTRELGIKTELGRDLARDLAASIIDGAEPVNRHGPVGETRWIPIRMTWN